MSMAQVPVAGVNPNSVNSDAGLTAEQYFRKNYGYEAWLLDIPSVRAALLPVLERHGDSSEITSAIEGTDWWRTQASATRQYDDLLARDPTEAANQVNKARTQLQQRAQKIGFTVQLGRLDQMATDAVRFGWDSYQYDAAIGGEAQSTINTPIVGGNMAASTQQVKELASRYFMKLDDQTAMNYGRAIANGTNTLAGVQAGFIQQQSQNRPELAEQLAAGSTMDDLFNFHRQQIASTLEIDPSTIDFVSNPTWQKVTDYVPPGETQRRSMTVPEALAYARSQTAYRFTSQANQAAAELVDSVATTWGKKA